jgi:hypothetical protein
MRDDKYRFDATRADPRRYVADFVQLFSQRLQNVVTLLDPSRPYLDSSPSNGARVRRVRQCCKVLQVLQGVAGAAGVAGVAGVARWCISGGVDLASHFFPFLGLGGGMGEGRSCLESARSCPESA